MVCGGASDLLLLLSTGDLLLELLHVCDQLLARGLWG